MPNNKDGRAKGPSQEERRRNAANQPLGGGGTPRPNPNSGGRYSRNDRRVRNVGSLIALIMLLALLSPLFFTCISQGSVQSYWPTIHTAYASDEGLNQTLEKAAQNIWSAVGLVATADQSTLQLLAAGQYPAQVGTQTLATASLPAPTKSLSNNELYVGETGHYIKAPFLDYWRNTGQAAVFGNPLSEAFEQNGSLVQLFDQALLVYHPELKGQKGEVQLGFLGKQLADAQNLTNSNAAFAPVATLKNSLNQRYFPETQHSLAFAFKDFWESNSLLKFLGFPISQELTQNGLTVQYFERGRLEYNPSSKQVNYSNSGDLLLAARGWPRPDKFSLALNIDSSKIIQGGLLSIQLSGEAGWEPASVQGSFGTDSLKFEQIGAEFKAFEPISPSLQSGSYPLTLNFNDQEGQPRQISRQISVKAFDYGTQDLELSADQNSLADHAADDYDDAKLASVYNAFSPQILWSGKWQWPLQVPWTLTTNFAQRRTINGKLDTLYFHGGLDMAPNSGAIGDPIYAPATGKVVYMGLLEARGNTVALDHGMGVTSYYFHLSQYNVQLGQMVQPGDTLGLVGTTGRATGPHLHWEVRVNGVITDPRTFIQQNLSK